ncbi:hypothetical protein [Streptomyces sp. MK37H]|uniref:hypothetical protein n=1 Tax=Streptomyces sp. MK37H TaxID=2699117 RepID=UPI001B3809BC|nr:hypothetical protein [Streptomyces sp. MK37H]MBP8532292.1 hypothetical protein [Streptomyces sp. MK37H]
MGLLQPPAQARQRFAAPLVNALEPKCNNTAYRPVMDAIDLLKRHLDRPLAKESAFFDEAEKIPLGAWARAGRVPLGEPRSTFPKYKYTSASAGSISHSGRPNQART